MESSPSFSVYNITLVSKGIRTGYLHEDENEYDCNTYWKDLWGVPKDYQIPPNVKAFDLYYPRFKKYGEKKNYFRGMHSGKIFYNPELCDPEDIKLLQTYDWENSVNSRANYNGSTALGRILGYSYPGIHELIGKRFVEYRMNNKQLMCECVPYNYDYEIFHAKRIQIEATLRAIYDPKIRITMNIGKMQSHYRGRPITGKRKRE